MDAVHDNQAAADSSRHRNSDSRVIVILVVVQRCGHEGWIGTGDWLVVLSPVL